MTTRKNKRTITKLTPSTANRRAFLDDVHEVFKDCSTNAYVPDKRMMCGVGTAASMSYLINRLRGRNGRPALKSKRMWVIPTGNGEAAWTMFVNAGLYVRNGTYNRYEDSAWRQCTIVYGGH